MARTFERHRFKEVSLHQLRSFCETARLGSLAAAASSLGLAQPTVWEQVHALERLLGTKLLQRQARGSCLTAAGRLLAELAAPLVTGADSLKRTLHEAAGRSEVRLTIAATGRTLADDLAPVVAEFTRRHPHIRLHLLETMIDRIGATVESGQADLGIRTDFPLDPLSPWLVDEPGYELDLMLVTPADHPLARRKIVRPVDLLKYPLINANCPFPIPDLAMSAALHKLGIFKTEPRRLEASYTAVIRRYVEAGFGIGLVVALPGRSVFPGLHERSMSGYFGRVRMKLVWRKTVAEYEAIRLFADTLTSVLKRGVDRRAEEK
jgi:molybdate transport repressor ModE-like protein